MSHIQRLSTSVVNKIAAGEVIERPASVVKELLENAIDAGAARIDVTVEGGGVELVRVADDGAGISADQLPLALATHATSKIREADDLFRVSTLGFRGEALASIAEISRLVIRSRTAEADAGAELRVNGGSATDVAPCGCPPGTIVEVRNLFYNTPVRQKFLRTTQTEMGHSSEAVARLALAQPQIHFTLKHNARVIHDLPTGDGLRDRVARLFGEDLAESLIWVESSDGPVRVSGYVANPSHSRANTKMQYLFLNGRHIRDRSLQHALGEAYRGLLLSGRFPIAFLQLQMPPEQVDVNVHPTKLEVRFQEAGKIYSQLLAAIRGKFLTTDLTARVEPSSSIDADDPRGAGQMQSDLVQWARGALPSDDSAQPQAEQSRFDFPTSAFERQPLQLNRLDRAWPDRVAGQRNVAADDAPSETDSSQRPPDHHALQVQNRYLITECEDGILVIDQHALHERVLYEQLREKVLSGKLDTQKLLVPEPVDLSAAEAAAVLESRELLGQLGIEVEPFGGDTVLVSGYPAMLANMSPADLLRQVADQLTGGGRSPEARDLLDDLLHMIACKAAIKAGDRLNPAEVTELLSQRHLVDDPHHCPHGRPTALVFSRSELDRRFQRK